MSGSGLERRPLPNQPLTVHHANTDSEILAAREIMLQLRPALPQVDFLATVRRMMQTDGYRLAALYEADCVRAVAGYRFMEMLHCGKIMYVDDLNTDQVRRSRGYGKVLMDWLKEQARTHGCGQLHLDSGVQREQTHRFYFREGLTISAYHFRTAL